MKILTRLILAVASPMVFNTLTVSPAVTQELNYYDELTPSDRNSLCNKFPLNSRCEDYNSTKTDSTSEIYQLNRNSFCDKFPFNSQCQKPTVEVIKLNLDRSGEDDEWVRIEKQDNKVKLSHTTRVKDGLVSGILNGGLGLVPVPLPFVEVNKYDWEDHQTIKVAFKSDRCEAQHCIVIGKDSITLSDETDLYEGLFTISYQEKDLRRSLSFRIPADSKIETIDTITIEAQQ